MIRVSIHNFQAWEACTFEVHGICAVVGATNSGKSSLLRAVMVALFSRTGNDFIRDDESFTEVSLEFSDPHPPLEVKFSKARDKSPVWVINGEEYTSAGRLGPREIFQQHGIYEYEVNSGRYNLVCQAQLEPIFVLRLPATQAYEIFAKVFERSNIRPAIAHVITETRAHTQTIAWSKGALEAAARSLEVCRARTGLLAALPSLGDLDALEHLAERLHQVSRTREGLATAERGKGDTWARASHLSGLLRASERLLASVDLPRVQYEAVTGAAVALAAASYDVFILEGQVEYAAEGLEQVESPLLLGALERFNGVRAALVSLEEASAALDLYGEAVLQEALAELARVDEELRGYSACPLCNQSLEALHGC